MSAEPKPDNLPLPPLPDGKFGLIALDPPWAFRTRAPVADPASERSPQRHYPTMDLEAVAAIPVREMALPDAFVMLWMTGPLLVQGVHSRLFRAWGVRPVSVAFVWIKTWNSFDMNQLLRTPLLEQDLALGLGFSTRQNAEFVMLGRIGSPRRARADIRQVIVSNRREHSRKPEEFYRRAEHFCAGPRLDAFPGADRPGWTAWGYSHRDGERVDDAAASRRA